MSDWNVFRLLADISHTLSKCILIFAIHRNKSSEGISLITQIFYLLVFCARYLPLPFFNIPDPEEFHKLWNITLKIFYLASSAYIILLMMRIYARTREREKAWKLGGFCATGSLLLAPVVMFIAKDKVYWSFQEFSWIFSQIFESVCVLPQLLLLRETTVPTVINSYYLVTLGSYRGFYLLNWFVRAIRRQGFEPVSVVFGFIQTALYIDFAWVYYTRQRVKLRGGTVVDSDDLRQGWLVSRFLGRKGTYSGIGGDDSAAINPHSDHWDARGLSVSADDGLHDVEQSRESSDQLADPARFEDEYHTRDT